MQLTSIHKPLFLANLLLEKNYSKKEIIEEFQRKNIKTSKASITKYLHQYKQNGINVKVQKKSRDSIYRIEKINSLRFNLGEINSIRDIKKLLISQSNYRYVKKSMWLFYRMAKFIKEKDQQVEFLNFGYYSTINWHILNQLEEHCREKNIIVIDYILPDGRNKFITIHTDEIKNSSHSPRIYLHGILSGAKQLSFLPVDRIFMIKKVIERNAPLNIQKETLAYVISKKLYDNIELDTKEKVVKITDDKVTIERSLDNDFYIIQRLLYLCPDLYYISDERIRKLFKEKLEMIKAMYEKTADR